MDEFHALLVQLEAFKLEDTLNRVSLLSRFEIESD